MAAVNRREASGGTLLFSWDLTQADATGTASSHAGAADRTVQVAGTFGGATVVIQGSNQHDPTEWHTLHDMAGADLSFTSGGMRVMGENPLHVRAVLTGGDGTTAIGVHILSRSRP